MLRGDFFFICNSGFQHGKVVSHSALYSAPGRTVCVWSSATKVPITFCDLQVLRYMKEYLNKLLWSLMHPFLHGKHVL